MQNNKWIIKGLTKLYIHVHVLIDIFMFTAANARWHFETKLRIHSLWCPIHDLWWDKLRTYRYIVLAQSQYAGLNYNIHSSKCWDFHLAFTYPWYSRPKCSNNQSFFFCKTILWIFRHCNRGNKIAREIRFTSLCSQKCIML